MIWNKIETKKVFDNYSHKENEQLWIKKQMSFIRTVPFENYGLVKNNNLLLRSVLKRRYKNKKCKIVDFGGCLGATYLVTKDIGKLNYSIIETKGICDAGNKLYFNNKEINFFTEINKSPHKCDIVYFRTSLQYSKNWKKTIREMIGKKPKTIVLSNTCCGDIPTYATTQQGIPCWFINESELSSIINKLGYTLKFKSLSVYLPSALYKNIPKTHILNHSMDLIFERKR